MTKIDWDGFFQEIYPIEIITDKRRVHMKSRDYFWYSPILFKQLKACSAHALVMPKSIEEVTAVAAACAKWRVPVTVRGGGTGNYGQAVPLVGGIVLDITGLNQLCQVDDGVVKVHAGMMVSQLQQNVEATGQELLMWPSTKDQATIGGFISGGSGGIGSVRHGVLRDDGNVISLTVLTLQQTPELIKLKGSDIQKVHHAYGTNGIIVELELALVPKTEWVHTISLFEEYKTSLKFSNAACAADIDLFLLSTVDKRFSPHYSSLNELFPADKHAAFAMVSPDDVAAYKALTEKFGGALSSARTLKELEQANLPPSYECSYNHTTFQVLRTDRSWTYVQIGYPQPYDPEFEQEVLAELEPEMYFHHEFARERDDYQVFAIHLVKWSTKQRLYEIHEKFEKIGCLVFDAHDYTIAGGGMKVVDQVQVDFKNIADPHGLMNPGKTSPQEAKDVLKAYSIKLAG